MTVDDAVKKLLLLPREAELTFPGGGSVGKFEAVSETHVQILPEMPAIEPTPEPVIVEGSVTLTPGTGSMEAVGN